MSDPVRLTKAEEDALAAVRHEATRVCIHTADGFWECREWAVHFAPHIERIITDRQAPFLAGTTALRDVLDDFYPVLSTCLPSSDHAALCDAILTAAGGES